MAVKHGIFIWQRKITNIPKEMFEIKIAEITRYSLAPHIIALRIIYEVHTILFRQYDELGYYIKHKA